ncbi:acyl-CoA dehydrogenase family protein [Ornithinimicrobium avium]|uniref:Acyl-CoA dehydrogenase n=1 Tax=Ornithinimicrobium avium TaxID=2283195 RepID=A0A345NLK8_9MICO|nr:acyl-CoA dehydrogenase family protein [Ornithinimicrobium avium]AXH95916.1 acyl-CoA dehydrogenase [Ornithinimicrobium avium]
MSPTYDDLVQQLLPADLIATFRERAAGYDRDNRFFTETLDDLRGRGYLRLFVPEELGGLGASVVDVTRLQRRLAGADPSAALGINMHLVVTGAALVAGRRGLGSARAVLEAAAGDELFAFGISEAGNDVMLFDAWTSAEPDGQGGYALSGTKIFTSMSPAWDRLITHAKVAGAQGREDQLVFGVLHRGEGVRSLDDWDTHGMRASQSCTTVLESAPLAGADVLDLTPVGPTQDPLRFGIFGVFELTVAAVYCGVAERAVAVARDVALERVSRSKGIVHADDPDIRWRLADAAMGLDGAVLQIEKLAADLDAVGATEPVPGTTEHGPRWYLQLSGVKSRVTETALHAVDQCLRASGGRHFSRGSELERLSRDVRAGLYQPSDEESVHASYARGLLGDVGAER